MKFKPENIKSKEQLRAGYKSKTPLSDVGKSNLVEIISNGGFVELKSEGELQSGDRFIEVKVYYNLDNLTSGSKKWTIKMGGNVIDVLTPTHDRCPVDMGQTFYLQEMTGNGIEDTLFEVVGINADLREIEITEIKD